MTFSPLHRGLMCAVHVQRSPTVMDKLRSLFLILYSVRPAFFQLSLHLNHVLSQVISSDFFSSEIRTIHVS